MHTLDKADLHTLLTLVSRLERERDEARELLTALRDDPTSVRWWSTGEVEVKFPTPNRAVNLHRALVALGLPDGEGISLRASREAGREPVAWDRPYGPRETLVQAIAACEEAHAYLSKHGKHEAGCAHTDPEAIARCCEWHACNCGLTKTLESLSASASARLLLPEFDTSPPPTETFEAWSARLDDVMGFPNRGTFAEQVAFGWKLSPMDYLRVAYANPPFTTAPTREPVDDAVARYLRMSANPGAITSPPPAAPAREGECVWAQDEDAVWETGCGHAFEFNAGSPSHNHAKFCCYCGKTLTEKLYRVALDEELADAARGAGEVGHKPGCPNVNKLLPPKLCSCHDT